MRQKTNITALILLVLGIGGYFVTGRQSITALIPAFFWVALYLTGMLYSKTKTKNMATILAALVAVAGFAGTFSGIGETLKVLSGEVILRPEAAMVKAAMAVICIVYFALILPALKVVFSSASSGR